MKKILIAIAVAAVLCGCGEKENSIISCDKISVSADTLEFSAVGGSMDMKVESSGNWHLSGVSDWVTPSITEGKNGETIIFTADSYSGRSVREALFKVFSGSAVQKIIVRSCPALEVSLLSDSEVDLACDGGETIVKLDTNDPDLKFEYSGDGTEWINLERKAEVLGMTVLKFSVSRSALYKKRESTLTIKGAEKSVNVKFVQAQRDTVIVEGDGKLITDLSAKDMELKLRTNVNLDYTMAEWVTMIGEDSGVIGDDGLVMKTVKLHLGKALTTRFSDFNIMKDNKIYAECFIKQQNPNPILFKATDPKLRAVLAEMGWVLVDESDGSCEVLETGLLGSNLELAGSSSYSSLDVDQIDGMGVFSGLEKLSVSRCSLSLIDVSDCSGLKSVDLQQTSRIQKLMAGNSPVTEVKFGTGNIDMSSVTVSGNNIEVIDANYSSRTQDRVVEFDVTSCPKLTVLKAKREYTKRFGSATSSLRSIYVTTEQKSAIDAGMLTVEKHSLTNIVVK